MNKIALLDTDFIYKAYQSTNDNKSNTLLDLIMGFKEYSFYCHEIILNELNKSELNPNPMPWIKKNILIGKINYISDEQILDMLEKIYPHKCIYLFLKLLKESCDIFDKEFYKKYYTILEKYDDNKVLFLKKLDECTKLIPVKNGIGEKKSLFLIQALQITYSDNFYIFCSDDSKARKLLIELPLQVTCLSLLGVFRKLKSTEIRKENLYEYYKSYCDYFKKYEQNYFKVWNEKGDKRIKVEMNQLFEDIYMDKLKLLKNGDLQYR